MSAWVYGDRVPAHVRRIAELAEARLAGVGDGVVVAVGADDPLLAARLPDGPRVVVPAMAGRRPSPVAQALLAGAAATRLVDPCEAASLRSALRGPVVVAGVPAPPERDGAGGLTAGPSGARLLALWRATVGEPPRAGAAVTWVGGPAAIAEAAEAWARGDAVVTLPGAPRHEMLLAGGALVARSSLEAIEATRLLLGARPLAHELARRGRRQLAELDPVDAVVARFAEAIALAESA
ncbi:MAG TPA: hypothetical protein VL422_16725 [Miltoncostaea sp.]|nr:hypothetical protein [Miltoncostaea sp.]